MTNRKQRGHRQCRDETLAQEQQNAAQEQAVIVSLGGERQIPSEVEPPPPISGVKENERARGLHVCQKTEGRAGERQHAPAPKEANESELLSGRVPSDPLLVKLRRHDGRKSHGSDMEGDQRQIRTEADRLQRAQQEYVGLKVNGRRAISRVRVAVGEVESLDEVLPPVGDIVRQ